MTTQCDQDGKCTCKPNITGDKCDQSDPGYYNFPDPKGELLFSVLGEFVYFLKFPGKLTIEIVLQKFQEQKLQARTWLQVISLLKISL